MATNLTVSDFLLAVPRVFQRAGEFTLHYVPDQLDTLFSMMRQPGTIIADATTKSAISNASMTASSKGVAVTEAAKAVATSASWLSTFTKQAGIQHVNSLDGVFGYFASRWAVSTFLIAIILNRAKVYSTSRQRLHLHWYTRLIIRIAPIILFMFHIQTILQTMRCQTGSLLPTANPYDGSTIWNGRFAREGGPVYWLSSTLLSWETEEASCLAAGMLPQKGQIPAGSSSVIWPMFLSLCLSHLLETMSCTLEGRTPLPETAMNIFEHSLAFAEAEAVVRASAGLGLFGPMTSTSSAKDANAQFAGFTRSMVLQRLNVPPEVLLIAFISCCSHLSSHVLGVFSAQSRYRLLNTSIWGLSFMTAFVWSFVRFAQSVSEDEVGVLRYPTVCIIGFIPHLLILASIMACAAIYVLAMIVTIISPPTTGVLPTSLMDRFRLAHGNLQASSALIPLKIRRSDEFYTTLLKVGFNILTSASEAVYFNEGIGVAITRSTWLEEKRFNELRKHAYLAKFKAERSQNVPPELVSDEGVAEGLNLVDAPNDTTASQNRISGYARQKIAARNSNPVGRAATQEEGVGGSQRSGRWYMSWLLLREDTVLLGRLAAKSLLYPIHFLAPSLIPDNIRSFAYPVAFQSYKLQQEQIKAAPSTQDFWILRDDGKSQLAGENVDVETEVRKRFARFNAWQSDTTTGLDDYLYDWWRSGGYWGDLDASGDYASGVPDDEDLTSVISESDAESQANDESASDADSTGTITPTRSRSQHRSDPRDTPEPDFLSTLTKLLDPTTHEDKATARMLAIRLRRPGATTRSQFARDRQSKSLSLLSGRNVSSSLDDTQTMTPEAEEELLEKIILSRRQEAQASSSNGGSRSWSEGGDGLGAEGPQCVVCHCSARTILLWPCRCLCLCEDCRIAMAMNNFSNCVTCRREVAAYSRLYVP